MVDRVPDLRSELAGLANALAALQGQGSSAIAAASSPGVRRRLTALALEASVGLASREQARLQHEALARAMEVVLRRVQGRAGRVVAALPPPAASALGAPAWAVAPTGIASTAAPVRRQPGNTPVVPAPIFPTRRPYRPLPICWSPQPLLGFRRWEIAERLPGGWRPWPSASSSSGLLLPDGYNDTQGSLPTKKALLGAWRAWPLPSARAQCLGRGGALDDGEVPHTDGRCGRPPCGLYAYKKPEDLIGEFEIHPRAAALVVYGLVSLAGKVVEHERGYRAQLAKVEAAVIVGGGRLVTVDDPEDLRCLFAQPPRTLGRLTDAGGPRVQRVRTIRQAADLLIAYLGLMRDLYDAVRP